MDCKDIGQEKGYGAAQNMWMKGVSQSMFEARGDQWTYLRIVILRMQLSKGVCYTK